MAQDQVPVNTRWADCVSVDWEKKTMTAKASSSGLLFEDVLLGVGKFQLKPVKGCRCLIGLVENQSASAVLLYASEVDEVWINGDKYTILKAAETIAELQKEQARVSTFISAFLNAQTAAQDGGFALQAFVQAAMEGQQSGSFTNQLINNKVKHGD